MLITRINCAADCPTQRIPTAVVEPIQKLEETFMRQILRCAEVEVRIKLVDDGLVPETEIRVTLC